MTKRRPRISVITPSLNHGRFLRETVDSILAQSFGEYEHIIVDGGSTDGTLDILRSYPHLRWVVEADRSPDSLLDAYRKALSMAEGDYIVQCCVSDGLLGRSWFQRCVDVLDADPEVSLVWGLPQYMSEEGHLEQVSYSHLFDNPPPQKRGFLAFWLATGFILPEGNYCIRREVFDACFPRSDVPNPFRINPVLGFNYEFNTRGFLPWFIPTVANFGRRHADQRGQRLRKAELPVERDYYRHVRDYRTRLLLGRGRHTFRDGSSRPIGELDNAGFGTFKKDVLTDWFVRSPLACNNVYTIQKKARVRAEAVLAAAREKIVAGGDSWL